MFQQSQQLLKRYQTERCEESFTRLVELYSSLVYATAFRCVGSDPEAAKDITQTVNSLAQSADEHSLNLNVVIQVPKVSKIE